MQHHFHQLPNGLVLVGEHDELAHSLAMGFFVKTGSRDETAAVSGVSHFLEHMMFKGTLRRSPEDVNREFDAMGARYNAFTSEEETVYYGVVLPRFQSKLADLLADMMRPALRDRDFDMEKNVIIEEIAMYEDRPQSVLFDQLRTTYYGGHPLGNSILGSKASIEALQREQMHEYFARRYAANNLTLTVVGNYIWDELVAQAEELCGAWTPASVPRTTPPHAATPTVAVSPHEKFNRAHVGLMMPGWSKQDPQRYAASVACEVLGAGDGSRLYWALVHPGEAEAAQFAHDASDGMGVYYGYLLVDAGRAQAALDTVRRELGQARDEGLTAPEVERAKRRIASALVLGAETPMGRLRSVGFDWMYRGEHKSAQETLDLLLSVTVDEVNAVVRALPLEATSVVATGSVSQLN